MKIEQTIDVEDCFDGSLIKELVFQDEVTKEQIFALGKQGDVQYFKNFARPFFKIRVVGVYDLKGIQGNRTMRVHFKNPQEYSLADFVELAEAIV